MQAQPAVAGTAVSDVSDKEIAQRIATGDRLALVALMRRYNQKLYRTARSILGDDAEAEDACQDAWFQAWRAIGEFRADAALSTWLVRIAANAALGRLRKRKRRADVIWLGSDRAQHDGEEDQQMSDASEGPFDPPERAAMRTQMRELIEAAIDGLPAELRVVFVLRAVEDLSVEQTAQCLGIPQPTVRTRYFRARGRLRDALAREFDTCVDDAFSFAGERCDRIVASVLQRIDAATDSAPSRPPEQG